LVFEKTVLNKALAVAFDIPIAVTYWDGKTEKYGEGETQVHITFNKKFSFSELSSMPTLVLAEAYMNEEIEIEGSIQELVTSAYRKAGSFLTDQSGFGKSMIKLLGNHSQKQSREDIHSHYDIGNDFYNKWLDPTMTYSCAYFEHEDMTLEEAQIAKVHHILDKLDSKPGGRLLDIGCGWGTLMFKAVQEYGLSAVGVTLSEEQYYYVRKKADDLGLSDKVKVYLVDYRDLKEEPFDYITSVGMFEHVGKENLEMYFQKVSDYLKPNGRALIHGITGQHRGGRHYQKTLEIWNENYLEVFDEVEKEMGRPFARMWTLYLQACAASFEAGNIDVVQYLLTKGASGQGLPMTREYMFKKH